MDPGVFLRPDAFHWSYVSDFVTKSASTGNVDMDLSTVVLIAEVVNITIIAFTSGKGVGTKMTDNLKVKASKAVDDAHVAAHAVYDDATVAAHNLMKGGGDKAQKVSDDVKIGAHKAVSDVKIAAHEATSKLKKK
jgi:hypothetical protein